MDDDLEEGLDEPILIAKVYKKNDNWDYAVVVDTNATTALDEDTALQALVRHISNALERPAWIRRLFPRW